MAGPRFDVRNFKFESNSCLVPSTAYRVENFEYTKDVTVGIRTMSLRTVVPKNVFSGSLPERSVDTILQRLLVVLKIIAEVLSLAIRLFGMTECPVKKPPVPTKQATASSKFISYQIMHHHHHVPEWLGMLSSSLILKMKLVPPSLPRSSYVSSSFWFIL